MIFPHIYVRRITDLCPEELKRSGIDGLLLDIDGTLKDYNATGFSQEVIDWVASARAAGISVCLFSNGVVGKVQVSAACFGAPYVAKAYKPSPLRCRLGLAALGLPASRLAIVGDQIYADVLAGRLAGLRTILVDPSSRVEPWFTRLKRPFETPLRRWLRRSRVSLQTRPPLTKGEDSSGD